ncbi:unnamed protein product [Bursaphelenchus okinawaensis]|uniref:Uncharacterized protein n=1 Tax=Bursaphelenchus okinawaensis TaxID=465554 RepID=A0A811KER8_9BILA|nr:unnamed protein product [Bursaphelenchus okinawaensis]CAG9102379.1 unnamed protein product [Bursaphelenchus okinawaensis]
MSRSYRRTIDPYPSENDVYKQLTPDDFNFLEDRQLADYAQVKFFSQSNQNVLYDFIKAEDSAQTNQGGTEIIALKLGSSLFIPASLQLISGFSGLWPMGERGNYSCLIIHVIFSMLAIIYWFEPINYAALELNLRTEQLDSELSSLSYGVLLTLLVLGSLIVLLVTSLTMCNAILVLSEPCNVSHSHVDVHLGMATVIISVVCSALSVYVSSSTLRSVTNWVNPTLKNTVLYGFGLRELIITIYITLATGLCSVSTMTQQRNLRLAALILQLISLLLIFGHLLTADRITAVTHNIKVMFSVGLNRPVGPESILLLYTFIVILAILLVAHTISTIINLCKKCSLSEPLNRNLYSQHVEDVPEASNYRANL